MGYGRRVLWKATEVDLFIIVNFMGYLGLLFGAE